MQRLAARKGKPNREDAKDGDRVVYMAGSGGVALAAILWATAQGGFYIDQYG